VSSQVPLSTNGRLRTARTRAWHLMVLRSLTGGELDPDGTSRSALVVALVILRRPSPEVLYPLLG
jgi:hypothetical protein